MNEQNLEVRSNANQSMMNATSFQSIATDIHTLNASQDEGEIHNFNRFQSQHEAQNTDLSFN